MPATPQRTANRFQIIDKVIAIPVGGSILVAEANVNRVNIIFSMQNPFTAYLRPNSLADTLNGLWLDSTGGRSLIEFNWCTHGSLVTSAWYAIQNTGINIYVLEQLYVPKDGD